MARSGRSELHELRNVEALNFVRALAAGLPAGFHIAVGSRLELALGRLQGGHFAPVGADAHLLATLTSYDVLDQFNPVHVFDTLEEALAAYRVDSLATT
jgi:hypothetical protein